MIKLSTQEKQVVFMNALFTLGSTMGTVFVNVFVYSYTKSLELTVLYACCRYVFIPIFSLIGGRLSRNHNLTRVLSAGLLMMVIAYLMLLWIRDDIANAIWKAFVVAAITGGGEGLFWFSMNVINQNVAAVENRNLFLSNMGFLNGVANIGAPLVSALILGFVDTKMTGYIGIFTCVILIYVVVIYCSVRLSFEYQTPSFPFKSLFIGGSKLWKYQKRITVMNSMREGYTLILSGLLVFRLLSYSEESLSFYNAAASILLIVSYAVVGRRIRHKSMLQAFYVGTLGLVSSMLMLSFATTMFWLVLFGILNAVCTPLYNNGFQMIRMKTYSEEGRGTNVTGHVIAIEFLINVGRIIGLGGMVLLSQVLADPYYIQVATLLMALGGLGVAVYTYFVSSKESVL